MILVRPGLAGCSAHQLNVGVMPAMTRWRMKTMIDKLNVYLLRKQAELDVARDEGQTMVEYGLVLVAVALVALVAYNALGARVSTFVNGITF
jgi:Flp pilus assembly pilin Flp